MIAEESAPAICDGLYKTLTRAKRDVNEWAVATVSCWLEDNAAKYPQVTLMQERVREDADFWASLATPAELEAYLSASLRALNDTVIAERVQKRLAALAFKSMNPETRANFIAWAESQKGSDNDG